MYTENIPANCPENFVRDVHYILVCGIIWQEKADLVAGWELIRGLNSQNRYIRETTKGILIESGQPAMELLEAAFAKGSVTLDSAGECIFELFRAQSKETCTSWEQAGN